MSWPQPLHTSRDPWPQGFLVPRGAKSLMKLAESQGWLVAATYARGYVPETRRGREAGKPAEVHSVAVRFRRRFNAGHERGGWVIWESYVDAVKVEWKVRYTMAYGTDHWPVPDHLGVTQVEEYLKAENWTGAEVARWVDAIKLKAAQAKEDAKAKAKARPKKAKVI
jgi:hypothetical protein